jgi:hypothetical protein
MRVPHPKLALFAWWNSYVGRKLVNVLCPRVFPLDTAFALIAGHSAKDFEVKSPPSVSKERRHKDGAPSGDKMSERVGQPAAAPDW